MKLIDSHAHIDYDLFDVDRSEMLSRARDQGIETMINIALGPEPEKIEKAFRLFSNDPSIYFAVGVHPHDAAKMTDETLSHLTQFAKRDRVVAIGEIGLDYYYSHSPRDIQMSRFSELLDLAIQLNLPVTIHTRDAFEDTYRLLASKEVFKKVGGVIHCFTGSPDEARQFLDLGAYVSFSGIVTFKKAVNVQEACKAVPLDRMLIETDAPYLAPDPHRGKRNEPLFMKRTAEVVAMLKGVAIEDVANATRQNTRTVFRF